MALFLALLLAACSPAPAQAPIAEQWRAVSVEATALDFVEREVGALHYRGGLALASREALFGGFSGLELLEDGRLLAISDAGQWLSAELVLDASGALVGLRDGRVASMRDENAAPFQSKREGDSEGLAQLPDGRFAVSFEQTQSVRLYDMNRDGPFGAAQAGPGLAGAGRLPANVGLEAIAAAANGDLIVGAEGGGLWRAPLGASAPIPQRARYRGELGFSLVGLDRLPDGGFVTLERFYAPVIGARARITRFEEADISAGGAIEGEELARLAPPLPVENFEAIAAIAMPGGATRIYILSDNNFNARSRTLLLAFDIAR